jgi:hypothetical protein
MLSKELDIAYDDDFNLEIEGETVSEESQARKCRKMGLRAKQVLLRVGGWEDMTVGDDARGEMLPNKAVGPSKRQESTWGDETHREKISEKNLCQVKTL